MDQEAPVLWPRTPINEISRKKGFFNHNMIGKVIMTSGVEDWDTVNGRGKKLFFDVADETGIIRVFAWNEFAVSAGELIQHGRIIQILEAVVDPEDPLFNNLPHKYQMQLARCSIINILPDDTDIKIIRENHVFVPFPEVANFEENEYFNVTGTVVDIYPDPPSEGIGHENQNRYTRQAVEIRDDDGNTLRIMNWNSWIPLLDDYVGRTMSLIRCKYISKFENINASGALVLIDGEQIN